jgi:flagellar basal-body rod modification protein FlgD
MVDSIGSGLDLSGLGLAPAQAAKKDELGQEEFLNLMVTQLKNQDPFKPLESGEFLGQLAQFGTVSGLAELKTSFSELAGSLVSNQALQAASLVGRNALVASSQLTLDKAGAPISGAVDLPEAGNAVRIQVSDAKGQVVRQLDLGGHGEGLARFTWDGRMADGSEAPPGTYKLAASYQAGNEIAAADTLVTAPVESVVFGPKGFTVQVRGLGELPFSAVREIRSE